MNAASHNARLSPEFKSMADSYARHSEQIVDLLIARLAKTRDASERARICEDIDASLNEITQVRMALVRPEPRKSGVYGVAPFPG